MSQAERGINDLIVVGSGPAGLGAAFGGESERIEILVIDDRPQVGGQAGTSAWIENYGGFPEGISGIDLMGKFADQAAKFGAIFDGPSKVDTVEVIDEGFLIRTDTGEEHLGKNVLLSTGVKPRLLRNVTNLPIYLGRGVTYGSHNLSVDYSGKSVSVIGGGNSAGQAAYKLSEACDVNLFIRGDSIEKGMSGYLIDKIMNSKTINVFTHTEVEGVGGDGRLQSVTVFDSEKQERMQMDTDELFILIGSEPNTNWLPSEVVRDKRRYIVTGSALSDDERKAFMEKTNGRQPLSNETSMPGVFAAGDVRSGMGKRINFAQADGTVVITNLHLLRAS